MLVQAQQLQTRLASGIEQLGLRLPGSATAQLFAYLEQLHKWNRVFNLSGIRDPDVMLTHHLFDSLSLLPHIDGARVVDVGTGAGLPGLPLAICLPEVEFILIDSISKKTRFIFQTITQLRLANVEVVHARVEDYLAEPAVDIVTSRAFSSLTDFITSCRHLLHQRPGARLLAMKGRMPDDELLALPDDFHLYASHALTVPGLDAERCVLDLRPRAALVQ
ncbi:MAG: 16S rRNA (guanine(527)-N(7))-methyltransferase RsmG [Pseudomonadales bacterium]|jgi:16S rRNA (guanine527-N7)-methyltransferase|nr:16S rRNA (guanine(527)-N(7))-methyltransferase RsmG [Pseudomonadales bacterium]